MENLIPMPEGSPTSKHTPQRKLTRHLLALALLVSALAPSLRADPGTPAKISSDQMKQLIAQTNNDLAAWVRSNKNLETIRNYFWDLGTPFPQKTELQDVTIFIDRKTSACKITKNSSGQTFFSSSELPAHLKDISVIAVTFNSTTSTYSIYMRLNAHNSRIPFLIAEVKTDGFMKLTTPKVLPNLEDPSQAILLEGTSIDRVGAVNANQVFEKWTYGLNGGMDIIEKSGDGTRKLIYSTSFDAKNNSFKISNVGLNSTKQYLLLSLQRFGAVDIHELRIFDLKTRKFLPQTQIMAKPGVLTTPDNSIAYMISPHQFVRASLPDFKVQWTSPKDMFLVGSHDNSIIFGNSDYGNFRDLYARDVQNRIITFKGVNRLISVSENKLLGLSLLDGLDHKGVLEFEIPAGFQEGTLEGKLRYQVPEGRPDFIVEASQTDGLDNGLTLVERWGADRTVKILDSQYKTIATMQVPKLTGLAGVTYDGANGNLNVTLMSFLKAGVFKFGIKENSGVAPVEWTLLPFKGIGVYYVKITSTVCAGVSPEDGRPGQNRKNLSGAFQRVWSVGSNDS